MTDLATIVSQMRPKSVSASVPVSVPARPSALPPGITMRASGHYAVGGKLFRKLEEASACLREHALANPIARGE